MSDSLFSQPPLRIGVLGSGAGTNFQIILDKVLAGGLNAQIVAVASDVASSGILDIARRHDVAHFFIQPGKFKATFEPYIESRLANLLLEHKVELVVLAGFMRILKHEMLSLFSGRIINIHPSLLPKYPGLYAWKQALNSGDTVTGCTVHYVDSGVDTGKIIAQAEVDILPGDTPDSLHGRIQKAEHTLLPLVLQQISEQRESYLKSSLSPLK